MNFVCPVCAFDKMEMPPSNYEICPCCGTEFGNDDEFVSHRVLRERWISRGTPWFFRQAPPGWNPWFQLMWGNVMQAVPFRAAVAQDTRTYFYRPTRAVVANIAATVQYKVSAVA